MKDPLKQDEVFKFCRNRNKDLSILTETHINFDQIQYIRNNWLDVIFFSPGDSHTKRLLVLLNLGLEGVTKVDTDPKGRFVSFKEPPSNDRVLCFYVPSGHNTRGQVARRHFFEGLKRYMEKKNEENENKIILGDFVLLWIKWRGMVELKHFINVVSIMPCQNSSWIMAWRIYGEERTQIPLSSLATIDLLAQDLA